jgi:hypothetical protein
MTNLKYSILTFLGGIIMDLIIMFLFFIVFRYIFDLSNMNIGFMPGDILLITIYRVILTSLPEVLFTISVSSLGNYLLKRFLCFNIVFIAVNLSLESYNVLKLINDGMPSIFLLINISIIISSVLIFYLRLKFIEERRDLKLN